MADIDDYIKTELDKGFAKQDIETALIKAGYTAQDVKEAFSRVPITPAVADRPAKNPFLDRKYMIFAGIAIAVLIIGIFAVVILTKDKSTGSSPAKESKPTGIKDPDMPSQEYMDCYYPTWALTATCQAWVTGNNSVCRDVAAQDQLFCDTLALCKQALLLSDVNECMKGQGDAAIGCEAFMRVDSSGCSQTKTPGAEDICSQMAGAKRAFETKNKAICQGLNPSDRKLCEALIENSMEACAFEDPCEQYL